MLSGAPLALALVFAVYAILLVQKRRSVLNRIPSVGPSGLISSRFSAWKALTNGHQMIQEGYEKYQIFKIPRFFTWLVLVSGPEHLEDIRKATDDQISFLDALSQAGQFEYTISPKLQQYSSQINVVRGPMTRNIGNRFPDLLDELNEVFSDLMKGENQDWVHLPCYHSVVHIISRLSARFFAGPELSSNPRYTGIMQGYADHVFQGGVIIRFMPKRLKRFVNRTLFDSEGKMREVEDFLRPILMERLQKGKENIEADSNDMITWLWNGAPEAQRTLEDVAAGMVFLNIAAIQTTSALLTHTLFNLAAYPSYVQPLRDEISTITHAEGWTKVSIEKMRKLDSFIKESQRLHGTELATSIRLAMKDFTFSDGTVIPKGTFISVTGRAINQDEKYYPNPQEFQGFRFTDKDPLKWQMTALNPEYMTFGIGRHACPGRFFAVTEVKTIVARLLMDYDIKFTDEQNGRPKDSLFTGIFVVPNKTAKISLRKRRDEISKV